ncbi:MAG: TetR/AcrR family transcriptional regulator [Rhizobium sp.]|nr:TetR/AcrR family transcriptional regulator [Rhizobium sp.]
MTHPPSKYQPTDDRKRAIAAAARSLIVEKGFEGLRTREIADRVGINIATLHYHIPTKEALIELVAQSMKDDFMAQSMRHPRTGLPPLEQLQIKVDQHRETRRDNPELLLVMEEMGRRARHDESIARYINPMRAFWHQQVADILEAGVADGTFRADLDPWAGAYMVIGVMLASSVFRLDDPEALDRAVSELLRAIVSDRTKEHSNV